MSEIKKADYLTDHEKLEYIHHVLQECGDANAEWHQIKSALTCVEDIRETFFDKDGNTIRPNSKGYSTKAYIETDLEYAKRIQEIK